MEQTVTEEKKRLRGRILRARDALPAGERSTKSAAIAKQVLSSELYRKSSCVFIYMSHGSEVMTRELIEQIWRDGKKAALPKCENGEMKFWFVDYFGQLAPGIMGILEPVTHCAGVVRPADQEAEALVVMPGVVFDSSRRRIGYGGGYYDRYLAAHTDHPTAAVCYDLQVVPEIPAEAHDVRPDVIFTESRIFA